MNDEAREILRSDPALGPLVQAHGDVSIDAAEDPFRRLVVSIIRQQVSMASAAAIRERLFEAVEITPEGILAADTDRLTDAGLSAAKAEYVTNAAAAFERMDSTRFEEMNDASVVEEMTDIRGIGPWTAKMFLMFGLGREDVFPVEDLGIRKGMRRLFEDDMTRKEMQVKARDWKPYRSYASEYLWREIE